MTHPIIIESAGGEYMDAVLVVEWRVKPGDRVKAGDIVVVVETAKAATEIEATHEGFLTEIFYPVGVEAPVGATLGMIGETMAAVAAVGADAGPPANPIDSALVAVAEGAPVEAKTAGGRVVASPLARKRALEAGIDLSSIAPTALSGRIKKRDVEAVLLAGAVRQPIKTALSTSNVGVPSVNPALAAPATVALHRAPIVFLHGFGADRSAWRHVLPLLDGTIPTFALDLPGHGAAIDLRASSVADMAFAISDRLEEKGVDEAHIVGHSLGGAVALSLSQIGRVSIRSLCLLAPAGLGLEINHDFVTRITKAATVADLAPWLNMMVGDPAALPTGYAEAVLRQWQRSNAQVRLADLARDLFPEGVQAADLTAALAAIRVPARILWGRRDAIIPPAHAETIPGTVALHRFDGIGHVPQLECPEIVARLIGELVRSAH